MVVHRTPLPVHAAEATRVGQSHGASIIELEVDVVVLAGGRSPGNDRQVSGHTEVNDQAAALQGQQQVLRSTVHRAEALATNGSGKFDGPA